jgi:hypothetical protein
VHRHAAAAGPASCSARRRLADGRFTDGEERSLRVGEHHDGAEADDRTVAAAFNTRVNPLGARINAIWSSDIGHWDVPDLTEPLAESWDLVEQGVISAEDFRALVFDNPYRFYTEAMGFELVKAVVNPTPEGGWAKHVFYDTCDDNLIAFWDLHGDYDVPGSGLAGSVGLPDWTNHLAGNRLYGLEIAW